MDTYKITIHSDEGKFETIEKKRISPTGSKILVKIDSCAICTLEQRIFKGEIKRYPFAGGHEIAGTVEAVGEDVKSLLPGDKVALRLLTSCGECEYCRSGNENQCVISFKANIHEGFSGPGGFSQYMLVDAKIAFKMSPEIDLAHAALTEPLACCVHSISKGGIQLGDTVVVIGAGIMGALHIQLAKLKGARVIATEIDEGRLALAKVLGADLTINSAKENAVEKVLALTEGRGADVVFCTAALYQLAAEAVKMSDKLGRIVMYSSFHPATPIDLDVNRLHSSEAVITGAVNPNIRDFNTAARLLSYGLIDVSKLISHVYPMADIAQAFEKSILPETYRIVVKCS